MVRKKTINDKSWFCWAPNRSTSYITYSSDLVWFIMIYSDPHPRATKATRSMQGKSQSCGSDDESRATISVLGSELRGDLFGPSFRNRISEMRIMRGMSHICHTYVTHMSRMSSKDLISDRIWHSEDLKTSSFDENRFWKHVENTNDWNIYWNELWNELRNDLGMI